MTTYEELRERTLREAAIYLTGAYEAEYSKLVQLNNMSGLKSLKYPTTQDITELSESYIQHILR
jgi:hypothetical protein